jgi:hypothetical protein
MREDFLHFLWRTRRFEANNLSTTDQQPLIILQPGAYNSHAGPDFFNGRIRLGTTEWAGNIEMHVRSSEWNIHGHSADPAYDNVILHVVWEDDKPIYRANGELIPCLILRNHVNAKLQISYEQLMQGEKWIPCATRFLETPPIVRLNWYDRLSTERLEQKTIDLAAQLAATENHWEEAFYRILARSFGLKVNSEPFEMLARSLPASILAKHKTDLFQIESLLFGQAGLLDADFKEEYPKHLAKEYRYLQQKYGLVPMDGSLWKFLRLRPANFPTVRIAQFAVLVHQSVHLFSQILEAETTDIVENLFQIELSGYWLTHYRFDAPSTKRDKRLGSDFFNTLLINTLIPSLFLYGKTRHLYHIQTKAIGWLEDLPAEANAIIEGWKALGLKPRNGNETQALLQLKHKYCDQKRCMECAIGGYLIQ